MYVENIWWIRHICDYQKWWKLRDTLNYIDLVGYEEKSLQAQIPPPEKASPKIPPEENPSQQNASTLKSLPAKHL